MTRSVVIVKRLKELAVFEMGARAGGAPFFCAALLSVAAGLMLVRDRT